jgi:ActR/RegA family two-component response regulator
MSTMSEENVGYRPCLVLAHTDAAYAAMSSRAFRRRGWDVYNAQTGPEARRLARMLDADLVVLDTALPGESGWLTCEKLTAELPGTRVVLVAPEAGGWEQRFAEFVGAAAVLRRGDGASALLGEVPAAVLPAAG